MPFKPRDLAVIATAGKFTMFQYAFGEKDSPEEKGFFDRAADRMHPGDVILASLPGPATKFFTVISNEGKKVVIAPQGQEGGYVPKPAADSKPATGRKGTVSL